MIVISNKPGQLGNLVFIYASFLAYGLENNTSIINPAFYKYSSYFNGSSRFSLFVNKIIYSLCFIVARVLYRLNIKTRFINVIALDNGENINLENAPALKSKICFVQGWSFRSNKFLLKHKKDILTFFSPTNLYKNKIDLFFKENFLIGNNIIIAVHVRQGDYKTFENGKFYYSVEQYIDVIDRLSNLFPDKKLQFLICSNEKINVGTILEKQFNIVYAPNHELLDMYCMTRCNYIVGPPSTYTMWASFFGNIPLYMIHDINKPIEILDFKVTLS